MAVKKFLDKHFTLILFFFFGVVIGSQHYKPQKLNSFIKLFDLRNGKMLQVYDAYQGGRPSRTILYDKNNKNNYIDIDMLDTKFQAELAIKPRTGFDINFLGAVRYVKSSREHKITENSNQAEAYRAEYDATIREANKFLYDDPDTPGMPKIAVWKRGAPTGGRRSQTDMVSSMSAEMCLTLITVLSSNCWNVQTSISDWGMRMTVLWLSS